MSALEDELKADVAEILRTTWKTRVGRVVPDVEDVGHGNVAVELLPATVLYADISGSTKLVDQHAWHFAAEVYKSYLKCASRIVIAAGGSITAFDGDRIMAVFVGNAPNSDAALCALRINWARCKIVNPAIANMYGPNFYEVEHAIGIDKSDLRVARTGVRGTNDLVWVGRAANYAAKLSSLGASNTWITSDVFGRLRDDAKFHDGQAMWEQTTWNGMTVYRSSWWKR